VRSIQSQSYRDWELIVCDDGSRDNSLDAAHQLAATDSRIQVIRNDRNLGLAATMNRLVSAARGEYIAVQEQDDCSLPDRLAMEVAVLDADPSVGIVSGIADWIDDDGRIFNRFPGLLVRGEQYPQTPREMVAYLYTEQCKVVNAGCMFRASVADGPEPFDSSARISIDWQFFLHAAHGWRFHGLPHTVVRMRRGQFQHLSSNKRLQFAEARRCISLIYRRYRGRADSPVNYRLYRQAMAAELTVEGRYWGGLRGLALLSSAILYSPQHRPAWAAWVEMQRRGVRKALRLAQGV